MQLINDPNLAGAALSYAARGWSVFPLHGVVNGGCTCGRRDCNSAGKHPLVRHGLKEATIEAATIGEWWSRWPLANIGIATGKNSGVVVIDIDLPRALASLDKLVHKLPSTLTGCTGGGGLHLIYRGVRTELRCTTSQVPGIGDDPSSVGPRTCGPTSLGKSEEPKSPAASLRCSSGRLPGIDGPLPGVDLRAEGGYIVAPPSLHRSGTRYTWLDPQVPIAMAPSWLKQPERKRVTVAPPPPRSSAGNGSAYGLAVLRNQLDVLRNARVGERNHTLNRCAFIVARFVAGGHLNDSHARGELHRLALHIGLTEWETTRTITSAFEAVPGVGR